MGKRNRKRKADFAGISKSVSQRRNEHTVTGRANSSPAQRNNHHAANAVTPSATAITTHNEETVTKPMDIVIGPFYVVGDQTFDPSSIFQPLSQRLKPGKNRPHNTLIVLNQCTKPAALYDALRECSVDHIYAGGDPNRFQDAILKEYVHEDTVSSSPLATTSKKLTDT